jgi:hypothetical protein
VAIIFSWRPPLLDERLCTVALKLAKRRERKRQKGEREQAGDEEQGDETPREEEDMRQLGHSLVVM